MAEIWGHIADSRNISMYLLLLSVGIFVTTNEKALLQEKI